MEDFTCPECGEDAWEHRPINGWQCGNCDYVPAPDMKDALTERAFEINDDWRCIESWRNCTK